MYKKELIKGLEETYNISVKMSNLENIVTPEEFLPLINSYEPIDFSLGDHNSENLEEYFKNVIAGRFRITLHNHSLHSDGRLQPLALIRQAAHYANKVAHLSNISKNCSKPPFVIALTDHDEVVGCQEIVKEIALNSDLYKNIKFICGGEFGAKINKNYFDLTTLCLNPFDKNLLKFIEKQKQDRLKTVQNLISYVNNLTKNEFTLEELQALIFKNKTVLYNMAGMVFISDTKNLLTALVDEKYKIEIQKYYDKEELAYINLPPVEDLLKVTEKAHHSWTHPIRSFKNNDNLTWHEEFLANLIRLGINGVEANHQYTYKQRHNINLVDEKNLLYRTLAIKHNLFLSGGTDSHEFNIFGHHHSLSENLLLSFYKY